MLRGQSAKPAAVPFVPDTFSVLEELCLASPAVVDGKLLLRTASRLYCIAP